jgi:hypothetical protein
MIPCYYRVVGKACQTLVLSCFGFKHILGVTQCASHSCGITATTRSCLLYVRGFLLGLGSRLVRWLLLGVGMTGEDLVALEIIHL